MGRDMVHGGGISNESLEDQVRAPADAFLDSPVEDIVEKLLLGFPGVFIVATESSRVLMKRQTWQSAVQRSLERGIKTGAAEGAAVVAMAAGVGPAAIPASILVRLGVDRAFVARSVVKRLDAAIAQIEALEQVPA
jgi:hypothetical protein